MASKKRSKAYRPRALMIPKLIPVEMVTDVYPMLATQLYAAIITFCERPSVEASNNLSHQLCCIAGAMSHANRGTPIMHKRDAASNAIRSAILCIEGIGDRFERTGVITVNEVERTTLHNAAGKLDDAMRNLPVTLWRQTEREVHLWIRTKEYAGEAA